MMTDSTAARLTRDILLQGEQVPPSDPLELKAGPLSLCFHHADLRRIRLGRHEILRRIYVAVRDAYWNTLPTRISRLRVENSASSFCITFDAENVLNEIDFCWKGIIEGKDGGTILFSMEGEARSSFQTNRIGICVLHPVRGCAGLPCSIEHIDGIVEYSAFPALVSPRQPFRRVRSMLHEVVPGLSAEVHFEGDIFETEDQRNWTDASYKTYCPPLEIPFPVSVERGTRFTHAVTLTLRGAVPRIHPEKNDVRVSVGEIPSGPLPAIGLGMAAHGEPFSQRETDRLRSLRFAHLRVDLNLSRPDFPAVLERAGAEARALGCGLEAAVFMSDAASEELQRLVRELERCRPPVSRWLVFHINERSTSGKWVRLARSILSDFDPKTKIGAGTNLYFAELNRRPPRAEELDFVCFSVNPQVHASDRTTLIENLEAQALVIESARSIGGGLPVAVSPVTLKPRFNPNSPGTAGTAATGELPSSVDLRQMSLFGAGWTIGSMKHLAEAGVASITYFETTGWKGVMERDQGSPIPGAFPSLPGSVFPMYFAFLWTGEFAGGSVLRVISSHPLRVQGLGLVGDGMKRLLLANLEASGATVRLDGLSDTVKVLRLNERTAQEAMLAPEKFASLPGDACDTVGGDLELQLLPFEIVRIDAV